jgi:hypothetical protein
MGMTAMFDFDWDGHHERTQLIHMAASAGRAFKRATLDVDESVKQLAIRNIMLGPGLRNWSVHTYYPEGQTPIITLSISTDIADDAIAYFSAYQDIFASSYDATIRTSRKKWQQLRKDGSFRMT